MKFVEHPACRVNSSASITILLSLLILTACETTGGGWNAGSGEQRAERLAANGAYADAASVYIGMAAEAVGTERDRLTLLATEQWLNAGDIYRARNAYSSVATPGSGPVYWLWSSISAAFALYDGEPDQALSILEPLSREALPLDHRLRVEALRADAWFQNREPARAIELLIQRESWLVGDVDEIKRNRQRIWSGLLVSDHLVLASD